MGELPRVEQAMRQWHPDSLFPVYLDLGGDVAMPLMVSYLGTCTDTGRPQFAVCGPAGMIIPPAATLDESHVPDWADTVVQMMCLPPGKPLPHLHAFTPATQLLN